MKTIEETAKEFSENIGESLTGNNSYKQQYIIGRKIGFKSGVEFAQRWISVEEELPSEDNELIFVPVIAITGYGNYRIATYDGFNWISDEVITFWRPIEIN